jgi:hypothetical protein
MTVYHAKPEMPMHTRPETGRSCLAYLANSGFSAGLSLHRFFAAQAMRNKQSRRSLRMLSRSGICQTSKSALLSKGNR